MEDYCTLLFVAGLDTVTNSIGFGLYHLASDIALQNRLRSQPDLIPDAVDELLRRYSIVQGLRYITADSVFHGVSLKAKDRVILNWPGAHLDNERWPDASKADVDRADKDAHITFGAGPHRCVGAHLARMELRFTYEEFLARIPEFRLDPENPPQFHGGLILGVDRLNLVWGV
jgi:cytochrome P450